MTSPETSDDSGAIDKRIALICDRLEDLMRQLHDLADLVQGLKPLMNAGSSDLKPAFKDDIKPAELAARHRLEHRMGRPSKLDSDPELTAFVRARIETMTFKQIADAVKANFPPDRRISLSSVHRWWMRERA